MIINWPVTSKPYSICGENEKHAPVVNQIFVRNYN